MCTMVPRRVPLTTVLFFQSIIGEVYSLYQYAIPAFYPMGRPSKHFQKSIENGQKSTDLTEIFLSLWEKLKSSCSGIKAF